MYVWGIYAYAFHLIVVDRRLFSIVDVKLLQLQIIRVHGYIQMYVPAVVLGWAQMELVKKHSIYYWDTSANVGKT